MYAVSEVNVEERFLFNDFSLLIAEEEQNG
jgi:hypothetical protein